MTVRRRRSDRSGRSKLHSPGRPDSARREELVRFWAAIATGRSSEDAARDAGVSPPVPNYSVLIVCDDTKVVGNGVSDCFPFPGQGLVEEPEDGLGELSEIGIKPVVRHMPVHDAP